MNRQLMGKRIISSKENSVWQKTLSLLHLDHIFNELMIYAKAIIQIFPFFYLWHNKYGNNKGGSGRQTHLIGEPAF